MSGFWFTDADMSWMDLMKQHETLLQAALAKHVGGFLQLPSFCLSPLPLSCLSLCACVCVCVHAHSFSFPLGSRFPLIPSLFASVHREHLSFFFLLCQHPPRLDGPQRDGHAVREAWELKGFK